MEIQGCLAVFTSWPSFKLVAVSTMDYFSSRNTVWKMDQILQLLSLWEACICILIIWIRGMNMINLFCSSSRNDFKWLILALTLEMAFLALILNNDLPWCSVPNLPTETSVIWRLLQCSVHWNCDESLPSLQGSLCQEQIAMAGR